MRRPTSPEPSAAQANLIDALGGPTAVARMLTERTGHKLSGPQVGNWKKRGIPYRYRAPIALEAGSRGIGVPVDFLGEQVRKPVPSATGGAPWLE